MTEQAASSTPQLRGTAEGKFHIALPFATRAGQPLTGLLIGSDWVHVAGINRVLLNSSLMGERIQVAWSQSYPGAMKWMAGPMIPLPSMAP